MPQRPITKRTDNLSTRPGKPTGKEEKLKYCLTCKRVYETVKSGKHSRPLYLKDFPTYGLERVECSTCQERGKYNIYARRM